MTTASLLRRTIWLPSLLTLSLVGCATTMGEGSAGGRNRIEVVGPATVVLARGVDHALEFRYVDSRGNRIPDAVIEFAVEGVTAGATLSATSSRTDSAGLVRVGLRTGDNTTFTVLAGAAGADPASVRIEVSNLQTARLEYVVTYGGVRRFSEIKAVLFTNTNCALIQQSVPAPRNVQTPSLDRRETFSNVEGGVPVAVFAIGMGSVDSVAAEGCADTRLTGDSGMLTVNLTDIVVSGGRYEVEEVYDLREANVIMQMLNALFGLSSDPAGYLVDFVRNSSLAPSLLRAALDFSFTRSAVKAILADALQGILPPGYGRDLRAVHDDFRAAVGEFTLRGELQYGNGEFVDGSNLAEPADAIERPGYHRISRVVMPLVSEDRPLEYRVVSETPVSVIVSDSGIDIPHHEVFVPLGQYVRSLLYEQLLPRMPRSPDTMRELLDDLFDCLEISRQLFTDTEDEELAEDVCNVGVGILGDTFDRWLEDLDRNGHLYVEGFTPLRDSDGDFVRDEMGTGIMDGTWTSDSGDMSFPGTIDGTRSDGTSSADHPVLQRLRDFR